MDIKLNNNVSVEDIDDKLVILNNEDNKLINVNDIGKIIIQYIHEHNSLDTYEIIKIIKEEYKCDCSDNEIKFDIINFVDGLINIGILVK